MFDIGWSELLVIGAIALIVVGPKDLPKMLRTFGNVVGKARGMAREFQRTMEDAAREADVAELRDVQKSMSDWNRKIGAGAPKAYAEKALGLKDDDAKPAAAAPSVPSAPPSAETPAPQPPSMPEPPRPDAAAPAASEAPSSGRA